MTVVIIMAIVQAIIPHIKILNIHSATLIMMMMTSPIGFLDLSFSESILLLFVLAYALLKSEGTGS